MTLAEILADIHVIDAALVAFEREYGLLSDTFILWYQEGHEPEEQSWVLDFAEWAGLYKSRKRLYEMYQRKLNGLQAQGQDLGNVMRQTQRALATV